LNITTLTIRGNIFLLHLTEANVGHLSHSRQYPRSGTKNYVGYCAADAGFFTVQQKLNIPGALHSGEMRIDQEEHFASRASSRTHRINENETKQENKLRGKGAKMATQAEEEKKRYADFVISCGFVKSPHLFWKLGKTEVDYERSHFIIMFFPST
jgi:hypothetical protein